MKLVSEMRESMWAVVQVAISELEVDFVAYANDRYERFEVLLAAMELGRLLIEAAAEASRARAEQLRAHAEVARVEERLGDDLAADETPEDADLDLASRLELARRAGRRRRSSARRCSRSHRSSPARRSTPSTRTGSEPSTTVRGSSRTRQASLRVAGLCARKRLAPDEGGLFVHAHGEAEARLKGRVGRRDVASPDAVALLETQRLDRLVTAGDEAVWAPGGHQGVPEPEANSDGQ